MNSPASINRASISAVLSVLGTYYYFLIFAEFAFLERVSEIAPGAPQQQIAMLALGLGGVAGAAGAAALRNRPDRVLQILAWLLRFASAAAISALFAAGPVSLALAGFVSGAALGALTVTLAPALRHSFGDAYLGVGIGVGTGLAYAICNVPIVFHASPKAQTLSAAVAVALSSFCVQWMREPDEPFQAADARKVVGLVRWTVVLFALVWLDSAVFYIIQHTPALRSATWERPATLWGNAVVHLAAAVLSGVILDRANRRWVIAAAAGVLGLAALALNEGSVRGVSPNLLYVAGVSLYSVALVEIPARTGRPLVAAAIFIFAGWAGSAMGIGMAQNLAGIPPAFVVVALGIVAVVLIVRPAALVRCVVLFVAMGVTARGSDVLDGREVYIAEGCIHCHSQYVRPQLPLDVLNWGPASSLAESLSEAPPLFGTRRQGPDLARVGNRRSMEWNRLHLVSPQAVSPGSRMPSYRHLFSPNDPRGPALLAYLSSLGADTVEDRQRQVAEWTPSGRVVLQPNESARLFARLCAQCHGGAGDGNGILVSRLSVRPPDWSSDPWRRITAGSATEIQLCRIIKFGIPASPMAGHEYLSDDEVVGLALFVKCLHKTDISASSINRP